MSEQVTGQDNKRSSGSNDTFPERRDIAPVSSVSHAIFGWPRPSVLDQRQGFEN